MDVIKKEGEVILDVIEDTVAQTVCIVDAEKDKKCIDNPKNKCGEVIALLDGIVAQTAFILDAEKDHKCMDNPKIESVENIGDILDGIVAQTALILNADEDHKCMDNPKIESGEDMGVVLDVIEKEKTMNDIEKEDEVLDAVEIINDENSLVAVDVDISEISSKITSSAIELDVGRTNNILEDITQTKNGMGLEEKAAAQLLLKKYFNKDEIEVFELIDNEDDEKSLNSPPVEPMDITQNRNGMGLEEDTSAQIHPETNSQENEIEIIEILNAKSQSSADGKRSQRGSKKLLKESLFIPYHEETNTGLNNFTGVISENLTVNDEHETWFRYHINRSHRQGPEIAVVDQEMNSGYAKFLPYINSQAAASGNAEVEKKKSSKQMKTKPELTRHSLMKNLKAEIDQKKEASFDRHKKIEQADEEIYDEEDEEMYEGEADDEDEDLESDGFCPQEKLFPDIKFADKKTIYQSNFGNCQSDAHPSHQHAVVPSSRYMQSTQCFASQDSEDIQRICSGQFSNEENQLSVWSPNSQRKMETDENNDDVIVIAEKTQSFEENDSLKRKRECSSPSPINKKLREEELSSCSSPGGWEETFPTYSPQSYDDCNSPYCSTPPTPTNHGDSSDGECITSGAKKCKILNYSSEEDCEVNESSVIGDDKDKNISHQLAMVSPCNSVSANEDKKNSSHSNNSESSEDCSDSNDVEVNEPSNITTDKDKNTLPKAIKFPDYSVSGNGGENSLNPMELSLQVKNHDAVLQKPNKMNEFLELEAELDSNEEASSDESESEFPEDKKNDLFDDVPVTEENQEELAIIHHKYICEDDAQAVKQLQEQYLPGGELHEDGKGRQKKFLWNNNDSSTAQNETLMSDSEQEEVAETSISQEKAIWRQKATVVHGSDSESDDVNSNEKPAKKLPVNIVGKANTSQVINKSFSKASPSSTAIQVRRSGSLIGMNGSNKLNLKASNTGQKKTVLFKTVQDAHQQDGI